MSSNQLEFFDTKNKCIYNFAPTEQESAHWIGGTFSDSGFFCEQSNARLIYTIDQSDSNIPTIVPNQKTIPIVLALGQNNRRNYDFVYRVTENEIVEVSPPPDEIWLPYDNYPQQFERFQMCASKADFDITNTDTALKYVSIFGLKHLSPDQLDEIIEYSRDFYENPMEILPIHELGLPIEQFVHHLDFPFWQEKPSVKCQNPNCNSDTTTIIALLQNNPHPNVQPWFPTKDVDMQFATQFCYDCECFTTSSQGG